MSSILSEIREGVLYITLNNPQKMNCMGFEMLESLQSQIVAAANNSDVKCVVLQGAGERAFSTGANLKEFAALNESEAVRWIELGNEVFNQLEKLKKPTVALMNGYVMGGGVEMALACDFRVATHIVQLALPEVGHGWLPGWGGMTRLRRLVGEAKAKEMVLLGDRYGADELRAAGLVNKVVESLDCEEVAQMLIRLSELKPAAYNLAKQALMDATRTTDTIDVQFDVLAMQIANN